MTDLQLNTDFDLEVSTVMVDEGDFVIAESTEQNLQLLAATTPGQWRESPTAGIGISDLLLSEVTEIKVKHTINRQLRADGAKLQKLTIDGTDITIEATYEN